MRNSINIQYGFIRRLHLSRYNSNANKADMRDIYPNTVTGMQHLQSLGVVTWFLFANLGLTYNIQVSFQLSQK